MWWLPPLLNWSNDNYTDNMSPHMGKRYINILTLNRKLMAN